MPTFPRAREPNSVSILWLPTGLRQRAHSGKIQLRNTQQVGYTWKERWDLVNVRDTTDMALMAFIRNSFNRQVIFDITHLQTHGSGLTRQGAGTPAGSILVKGAAQTGSTLITDGWPINTPNSVRAGDFISVGNRLFEVSANAGSDGIGDVTIPVTPNVFNSPADNAVVTIDALTIRSMLWELPQFGQTRNPSYYSFTLTFVEVIP